MDAGVEFVDGVLAAEELVEVLQHQLLQLQLVVLDGRADVREPALQLGEPGVPAATRDAPRGAFSARAPKPETLKL